MEGLGIAWMLVKLLTGVFDPPPDGLSIPRLYLGGLIIAAFGSVVVAVIAADRKGHVPVVERLRELQ